MGVYKIYKYTNKINGKVYIGQTRQSVTARAMGKGWGYKKCPHFFNAIQKYGWENFVCEILHENLNRDDADILEQQYIDQFKEHSYNIDKGGKSKGPHKNNIDVREKISVSMNGKNKGEKNGMFGVDSPNRIPIYVFDINFTLINTIPCITNCSKLLNIGSSRLSGYLKKYDILKVGDKYYSKFCKVNDSNSIKEYKPLAVGISLYDMNGILIKHYKYTKDACKDYFINENLLRYHRNKPWVYKNYIWVFDDIKEQYNIININNIKTNNRIFKPKNPNSILENTKIYKYDLRGVYIKSYNCLAEASKEEKITYNSLKRIHYGPWICNGYIWSGKNDLQGIDLVINACKQLKIYTNKTPILQFNQNRQCVYVYESLKQVKEKFNLSRETFLKYIKNGPFEYKNYLWTDVENSKYILDILYIIKNKIIHKNTNRTLRI